VIRDTLLLVTTSYPERFDGSEAAGAFVSDLAEELATKVPVRVVAPGACAGTVEMQGAVSVRRFAATEKPLSLLSPTRPADWPALIRTLQSLRAQTLAADSDSRIAHILALWVLPSGWAAAALHRAHGVPYSVWALGSDIWSLGRRVFLRPMLKQVVRGAEHCYADGLKLADDAADIGGRAFEFLPSTRRIGGNQTSPVSTRPPYRLLFLGRWHTNKGIDLLLDALSLLEEHQWKCIAEVHIAGGGPLETLVRSEVNDLQSVGRPVRLSGYLDRAAASEAIVEADWLLIPSRIESIPVVFSDAMKMRRPVVVMPVGDLPELMSKWSVGVCSSAVTASAYAAALGIAVCTHSENRSAALANAAAQFSLDQVIAPMLLHAFGMGEVSKN
jgi:glycosyltransferase involved in cell wall biosynthesis